MYKLDVALKDNPYTVLINRGIVNDINNIIGNIEKYNKVFIITQQSILNFLKSQFLLSLEYQTIIVAEKESSKTISSSEIIINQLIKLGCTRDSLLIGLGGGSVMDLTGFIASIFMRGIDHLFIPTTLLGMVDACIGGKTGVNTPSARNVIGTFKQPKAVCIDPLLLQTLSHKNIINGFAEVIKYSLICDIKLYKILLSDFDELIKLKDIGKIESIIHQCCMHKINFIIKDEYDRGQRMILNFGHTIGHAIESYYKYQEISHGEAIYYGMIAASYLSMKNGYLSKSDFNEINNFITQIPKPDLRNVNVDELLEYIKYDKKRIRNKNYFILLNNIGNAIITDDVKTKNIKESINFILA